MVFDFFFQGTETFIKSAQHSLGVPDLLDFVCVTTPSTSKMTFLLSGCSKIWPNYQNFVESRRRPFEQSLFLFCFDLDPPKVSQNFCHVVHSTGNPSIVVVRDPFKPKEGSFLFTAAKHIFLFCSCSSFCIQDDRDSPHF